MSVYHEALLLLQPALVILHLLLLHHQPLLHLSLAVVLQRTVMFKGLHKTSVLSITNKTSRNKPFLMTILLFINYYLFLCVSCSVIKEVPRCLGST